MSHGIERVLTVKYIGPEILRREGTKEADELPPQSKKRKYQTLIWSEQEQLSKTPEASSSYIL